ncbi:50S ribosomal protein L15 [Desulforhabdus sp. TSK]|uniref:50S ribosomal protein L15 n=1 Tax=Desulforhabdus sp. TSK TaxID=2925014 RepID=UPI001FC85D6C|nr:50S ribosomal protein L15 [Desulforhabdus sp. TSK]GKT08322.1 50S ribosomal protein L15 [Desulforhabdus sp. TSK]
MRLDDLAPAPGAKKTKKRIGRGPGSGLGKTAARGSKGQNARSGGGTPPWFEGGQMPLQRRIPKRGFKNPFKKQFAVVNVGDLQVFESGTEVALHDFFEAGLVKKLFDGIKLLGDGEVNSPLTVHVHKASAAAVQKIEAAGGRVELIVPQKRN